MWQKTFEQYKSDGFTVVGLALDAEGIEPARRYYKRHGVTFPALVDPNYATGFGAVPKTFFVNELGVVQQLDGWRDRVESPSKLKPATEAVRKQWTAPSDRLSPEAVAELVEKNELDPQNLAVAVELASRHNALGLHGDARSVLERAVKPHDPREVAGGKDDQTRRLLGQAYFQLSRSRTDDRDMQVRYATLSFYLNPSVGYGKQIARIIAPEKFDRPDGRFDNRFREATLSRLRKERSEWLK